MEYDFVWNSHQHFRVCQDVHLHGRIYEDIGEPDRYSGGFRYVEADEIENSRGYCWWKKSCTSWGKGSWNPTIFWVLYIPGGWPWDFWTINSTMGLWSLFMLKSMNVNHGERLRWFVWNQRRKRCLPSFLHMVSYGLIGSNRSCWYTNPVNQLIQKKITQTLTIFFWTISGFCQSTVSHEQSKMYVFRFVR